MLLNQQWHGYRRGHQLLASTVELHARDQDLVDKLSDASGSLRPGERFDPYITIYPLPSSQFHVIARTWQDLDAARSGTVFTRSIMVPSDVWRSIASTRSIFAALEDKQITHERAELPATDSGWQPLVDPNLAELAETLFLERQAAIAAFGFSDTEAITGRLLDSIWPERRVSFAASTFTLGPRTLADRQFDLVFAPESARSRFAKWDGRRISASTQPEAPRHAWTMKIVEKVFRNPEPRLEELDEIGAFKSASKGEGSALRLALLWSDLKQNAPNSPQSLLGMLDILNSLGRRPWDIGYFEGLVTDALNVAAKSPTEQTWQFLQILVRKLSNEIPLRVVRGVFSVASNIATTAPHLFMRGNDGEPNQPIPHLLRPAVARGLAQLDTIALERFTEDVSPQNALSLMAESPAFTEAITGMLSGKPNNKLVAPLSKLAQEDPRSARRIAVGVSRAALSSEIAPLLRAALISAPRGNFEFLANAVVRNISPERGEVLGVLVERAYALSKEDALRHIALSAPNEAEGDILLLSLVKNQAATTWLVEGLSSDAKRLSPLLIKLMKQWSDTELRNIISVAGNKNAFLAAAVSELPTTLPELVRLLKIIPKSPPSTAAIVRRAAERLSENDLVRVADSVLDQLFSLSPDSVADILKPVLEKADLGGVIAAATSSALSGKQIGANIASIAKSVSMSRFVPRVDAITTKLAERRTGGFGREGYDGWSSLLRNARHSSPEALIRSADAALDYCLGRRNEPVGSVVAAAFPIVHARLAKKSSLPEIPFNLVAALLYASMSLFGEWDRAKEARHGLVQAFMRSSWEPAELLRAALDANISNKVLGYLISQNGGREYLRKIENSILIYPDPVKKSLKAAISDFRS